MRRVSLVLTRRVACTTKSPPQVDVATAAISLRHVADLAYFD